MSALLTSLLTNKHTSISGLVYLVAKFGTQLLAVWFPTHKEQFDATANIIEGSAVAYGLFAAGDANKSATKAQVAQAVNTGDTSFLTKPTETPKV